MIATAQMLTTIPIPSEQVRLGANVRWSLGGIVMTVPLFSFARWRMFNQLLAVLPAIMVTDSNVPFKYLIDDSDSDASTILDYAIELWYSEGRMQEYLPNIVSLLVSVSDPESINMALSIIGTWELKNNHYFIDYKEADRANMASGESMNNAKHPNSLRQLLYDYAFQVMILDDCKTVLHDLCRVNSEFKKKLLKQPEKQASPHQSALSDRRKQLLSLWKKSTD